MAKLDMQAMVDGWNMQTSRERASSQLTLGSLIDALQAMPPDSVVSNLVESHSYRGYYTDLAFEKHEGTRPASELLTECRNAMGAVFEGYKGGDYVMGAITPIWIASYGNCGLKLLAIHAGGEIETSENA